MDINKFLKREKWVNIVISLVLLVIGIILVAKPDTTLNIIATVLGGVVVAYGAYKIVKYFIVKEKIDDELYTSNLLLGIMIIVFGIILFRYIGIIESLLRIIIGVWILYNGLIKLLESKIFKNTSNALWIGIIVASTLTILFGLYITFYPGALIKILGTLIIIYAILDIIETIIFNKKISE